MSPDLEALLAQTFIDDRLEKAERFRRARAPQPPDDHEEAYESVTVRRSYPDDAPALRELAQRDGRRVPRAPLLVAEVSGRLLAARSLENGGSISDPFQPTAHLVELLALRSAHLREAVASPRRSGRLTGIARRLVFRAYS
jgi:hypothetical protein